MMRNLSLAALGMALVVASGVAEARWLSVDLVKANANNGQNFNRYYYANNNPYKFKDPDGRIVKIANDPNDPSFRTKAADAIDQLLSKPAGAQLVQQLQSSEHAFKIAPSVNGSNQTGVLQTDIANATTPGVGSGATIYFNPAGDTGPRDSSGSTNRPAFVGLGHEMGHAKLADEGKYNANYQPQRENSTPPAERQTVPIENAIRSEHGSPARTWYYDYED